MNILIPMAGAGQRFQDAGYKVSKPLIPLTDWRTKKTLPMVIAATADIPGSENAQVIYVDRIEHKNDGIEEEIKKYFPNSKFITIDYLTDGQASTCLLAKDLINTDEELFIGACDNGAVLDEQSFAQRKTQADAIIVTYRNHSLVLEKPSAHGWVKVKEDGVSAEGMSVKKQISDNPMNDHAVVASFWFKKGSDFVHATEKMIAENDRINGEFYVDQVMQHAIDLGLNVCVFEVEKYLCWGTPKDYEEYENTLSYWSEFIKNEPYLI